MRNVDIKGESLPGGAAGAGDAGGGRDGRLLGQPETTARLDNLHRFMGRVYFSMGVISFWAAWTIRQQGTRVYLIAFAILMAAVGRLVSMSKMGLPEPAGLWLGYPIPELVFPVIIAVAHRAAQRGSEPKA